MRTDGFTVWSFGLRVETPPHSTLWQQFSLIFSIKRGSTSQRQWSRPSSKSVFELFFSSRELPSSMIDASVCSPNRFPWKFTPSRTQKVTLRTWLIGWGLLSWGPRVPHPLLKRARHLRIPPCVQVSSNSLACQILVSQVVRSS